MSESRLRDVEEAPRAATPLAAVLFVALLAVVIRGALHGGGLGEVLRDMVAQPWGLATLVDLYVGFFLFAGWVAHRERSLPRTALWTIATMGLGNLIPCRDVLRAARSARGSGARFWHGVEA